MSSLAQRNFAGGELAPALYARTDQTKYATGLRTLRNWMVMRGGGVTNRPGTDYVAATKNNSAVRLLKFVFNASQTYVLEFGHLYLRLHQVGAPVVATGAAAWNAGTAYVIGDLVSLLGVTYYATAASTNQTPPNLTFWYPFSGGVYEIPTPYTADDLQNLRIVQSADVVTIVDGAHKPYDLRRYAHTRWTLAPIVFGPEIPGPTSLALSGGGTGVITYYAVTAVDATSFEESMPSFISAIDRVPSTGTPTVLSWGGSSNALEYNVYRSADGRTYGYIGTAGGVGLAGSDTSWSSPSSTVSTSTQNAWVAAGTQARNPVIAVVTDKATDGNYHVYAGVTVAAVSLGDTPLTTQGRVRAYYKRDSEPRVDAGIVYGPIQVEGEDSAGPFAFDAVINVPDNGYATLTIDLVPEVYGTGTGSVLAHQCTVDASIAPNNRIDWAKAGTGFSDANDYPGGPDMEIAPPTQQVLFASVNQYPKAVTYYQQRRLFADTAADPEKVWASRSGSFKAFTISTPLQDDDTVSFSLAGRQVNAVQHLLDVGRLILFTDAGVWIIEGDAAGILKPGEVNPRQFTYNGAGRLPPIVVTTTVLYQQARGSIVRDLMRSADTSGNTSEYLGNDLTVFASHLFDGYTLADWDYEETPHSIVWAARSDGTLLGLTYLREHAIWGWHRHDTDGFIENVCCLPEGNEDRMYLVVRREIDGQSVRYIERMASRQFANIEDAHFVDCALTYDGRNTTAEKMAINGGTVWDNTEPLTISTDGTFPDDNIGDAVVFTAADGTHVTFTINGYVYIFGSPTTFSRVGHVDRTVPADLRAIETNDWAYAVDTLAGLDHLEGKAVSVFADGNVVASPLNPDYPTLTVTDGTITLDEPVALARVGLPYIADFETLDLDTAEGPSLKTTKSLITAVNLSVEKTRGLFVGHEAPSDDPADALDGLSEPKMRELEDYGDPVALLTGIMSVTTHARWNDNGRVFVRQVDPLPATILAAIPQGKIARAR